MPQTRITPPVIALVLSFVVMLSGLQGSRAQDLATPGAATPSA